MKYRVIGEADAQMIERILNSASLIDGAETVVKPISTPPPLNLEAAAPRILGIAKPYALGATSLKRLDDGPIKPELGATIRLAITLSTQDFNVLEVLRSFARQQQLVAEGSSRTLKSKHLKQPDGFVWAGDLGAWNNGTVTWGFDDYFEIVQAMDKAATRLGYAKNIRWGGIWDMVLADYGGDLVSLYKQAIEGYKVRHVGKDFLDGPHFEWVA